MQILKYSLILMTNLTLTGCMAMQSNSDGDSNSGMGMLSMMPMMGMMNMSTNQDKSDSTKTTGEQHSKSYIIANKYCTQCHETRQQSLHTPTEWKPTLRRMIGYMQNQDKLQPDEYEKVMIEHYYGIDG